MTTPRIPILLGPIVRNNQNTTGSILNVQTLSLDGNVSLGSVGGLSIIALPTGSQINNTLSVNFGTDAGSQLILSTFSSGSQEWGTSGSFTAGSGIFGGSTDALGLWTSRSVELTPHIWTLPSYSGLSLVGGSVFPPVRIIGSCAATCTGSIVFQLTAGGSTTSFRYGPILPGANVYYPGSQYLTSAVSGSGLIATGSLITAGSFYISGAWIGSPTWAGVTCSTTSTTGQYLYHDSLSPNRDVSRFALTQLNGSSISVIGSSDFIFKSTLRWGACGNNSTTHADISYLKNGAGSAFVVHLGSPLQLRQIINGSTILLQESDAPLTAGSYYNIMIKQDGGDHDIYIQSSASLGSGYYLNYSGGQDATSSVGSISIAGSGAATFIAVQDIYLANLDTGIELYKSQALDKNFKYTDINNWVITGGSVSGSGAAGSISLSSNTFGGSIINLSLINNGSSISAGSIIYTISGSQTPALNVLKGSDTYLNILTTFLNPAYNIKVYPTINSFTHPVAIGSIVGSTGTWISIPLGSFVGYSPTTLTQQLTAIKYNIVTSSTGSINNGSYNLNILAASLTAGSLTNGLFINPKSTVSEPLIYNNGYIAITNGSAKVYLFNDFHRPAQTNTRFIYTSYYTTYSGSQDCGPVWGATGSIGWGILSNVSGSTLFVEHNWLAGSYRVIGSYAAPSSWGLGSPIISVLDKEAGVSTIYFNGINSGSVIFNSETITNTGSVGFYFGTGTTKLENYQYVPKNQLGSIYSSLNGGDSMEVFIEGYNGTRLDSLRFDYNLGI